MFFFYILRYTRFLKLIDKKLIYIYVCFVALNYPNWIVIVSRDNIYTDSTLFKTIPEWISIIIQLIRLNNNNKKFKWNQMKLNETGAFFYSFFLFSIDSILKLVQKKKKITIIICLFTWMYHTPNILITRLTVMFYIFIYISYNSC